MGLAEEKSAKQTATYTFSVCADNGARGYFIINQF